MTDTDVQIPHDLLQAISAEGGGRVVIVIGAGTSVEEPTGIPQARDCSIRAHQRLLDDLVLVEGDCTNPSDLSELAEVVHAKTGGQAELVARLPRSEFRSARPNTGTMIAAALLREGAVSAVLSLNFDLSLQIALAELGMTNHVALIKGPEDHGEISNVNFIYLHRSAEADPEEWVLRSEDLERSWKGDWEEMMAGRVMAAAAAVFAGLGSRAAVLVETAEKIRNASRQNARAFQVDPDPIAESEFAEALEIAAEDYIQCGWSQFMEAFSARLVLVHIDELVAACAAIVTRESWADSTPVDLRKRLGEPGLLALGRLRARWLLASASYVPRAAGEVELLADLLLAVGLMEERTGSSAVFSADGVIDFLEADELTGSLAVASGRGSMRWGTIEATLHQARIREGVAQRKPRYALVGGVAGQRPAPEDVAPPEDVLGDEPSGESIVGGDEPLRLVSVDELRAEPELAREMVS
jgi:hypothetical protein